MPFWLARESFPLNPRAWRSASSLCDVRGMHCKSNVALLSPEPLRDGALSFYLRPQIANIVPGHPSEEVQPAQDSGSDSSHGPGPLPREEEGCHTSKLATEEAGKRNWPLHTGAHTKPAPRDQELLVTLPRAMPAAAPSGGSSGQQEPTPDLEEPVLSP